MKLQNEVLILNYESITRFQRFNGAAAINIMANPYPYDSTEHREHTP